MLCNNHQTTVFPIGRLHHWRMEEILTQVSDLEYFDEK